MQRRISVGGKAWVVATGCALLVALAAMPSPAQAAFPGQNGTIAFIQDTCNPGGDPPTNGWLMWTHPDGSDWDFLGPEACATANWSPSGRRIMFDWLEAIDDVGYFQLGFVNPDGSQRSDSAFGKTYSPDADWGPDGRIVQRCLNSLGICIRSGSVETEVASGNCFGAPAWSPDGSKIALYSGCAGQKGIVTVPAAGGPVDTIVASDFATAPDWSPDGGKLVYMNRTSVSAPADLHVVDADGGGGVQLTNTSQYESDPAWSPDGTEIVFVVRQFGWEGPLYRMNADGSGVTQISSSAYGLSPDWQPLPVNTASTHVRPAGASPLRISLVPAAQECTAPNRTHGPPLAFGSCAPVQPGSPNLTVGVGDGSPAFARSVGHVRIAVNPGVPGGVDDTDVGIRFSLSNVMKVSDLSEYTGELRASAQVRLTDREGAGGADHGRLPAGVRRALRGHGAHDRQVAV